MDKTRFRLRNRTFWFSYDLCVVLAVWEVLNKSYEVKVCICIGDVYSAEEQFVWRLVWTVMPVSPCHLTCSSLSFPWRSWRTRRLTCQSLKIHISITESCSAGCEKLSAGKTKCLFSIKFLSGYAKYSVHSQVTSLASSSSGTVSCSLFSSANRMHQEVQLW